MRPKLSAAEFGSILVDGQRCQYDVYVRLSGKVKKRQKRLSRENTGSAHIFSVQEARHLYEKRAKKLIVGSGYDGVLTLSAEASKYFAKHGCRVDLQPTPEAAKGWNKARGSVIGLFHVTC